MEWKSQYMKLYSVKIDRIIQLYGWKRRLKERYPLAMNCVIFSETDKVCRQIKFLLGNLFRKKFSTLDLDANSDGQFIIGIAAVGDRAVKGDVAVDAEVAA